MSLVVGAGRRTAPPAFISIGHRLAAGAFISIGHRLAAGAFISIGHRLAAGAFISIGHRLAAGAHLLGPESAPRSPAEPAVSSVGYSRALRVVAPSLTPEIGTWHAAQEPMPVSNPIQFQPRFRTRSR